jgi:predicted DNA-binding transcriptional regulator AlpA
MVNLLTIQQAADYMQLSERALWYMIEKDGLPTLVVAGSERKKTRRIDPAQLREWIDNRQKVENE